jgi:4-amino-4-deoxy-L-arabinose transferase-like glycosyltransferase
MGSRLALFGIIWAYCGLVWLYALNTPTWEIPDEPAHYNYVRTIAEHATLPVLQAGDYDQAYLEEIKARKFPPEMSIAAIQYESHQPPLYYLLAVPFYVLGRDAALDSRLIGLRLFSGMWGAVLLAIVYRISSLVLPPGPGLAFLACAFVAFVPQHLAMLAGVNNDALADVVLAGIVLGLLRILGDSDQSPSRGRKTWWAIGLLLGAALLTKTTAYVSVGLVLVTFLILWRRGASMVTHIHLAAAGLCLGLILGAMWFVRDAAIYGPTDWLGLGRHDAVVAGQPRTLDLYPDYLTAATSYFPIMFRSFWGQFGWMGVLLDGRVYTILFIFSILALIGVVPFMARTGGRTTVPDTATSSMMAPPSADRGQRDGLVLLAAWIFLTFTATLAYSLVFFQAQGRYLFPSLGAIAIFAAAGMGEWIRRITEMFTNLRVPRRWTMGLLFSLFIGGMVLLDLYCLYRFLIPGLTSNG